MCMSVLEERCLIFNSNIHQLIRILLVRIQRTKRYDRWLRHLPNLSIYDLRSVSVYHCLLVLSERFKFGSLRSFKGHHLWLD